MYKSFLSLLSFEGSFSDLSAPSAGNQRVCGLTGCVSQVVIQARRQDLELFERRASEGVVEKSVEEAKSKIRIEVFDEGGEDASRLVRSSREFSFSSPSSLLPYP